LPGALAVTILKAVNKAAVLLSILVFSTAPAATRERWIPERAWAWHREQGFLAGANFIPSTAINQLEMWQASTFDRETIDRELGWAASLGFNSMRVFLHHLAFEQDSEAFLLRVDELLAIAARHGIGVMLVLFDGVWDPNPRLGPQRPPRPHVHNSGWVQSPGASALTDPGKQTELREYVEGVVRRYRSDARVDAWDLFNEADNTNESSYPGGDPEDKAALAAALLSKVFVWAREANPEQPLTAGIWRGPWPSHERLEPIEKLVLEESDVVSFHNYGPLDEVKERVEQLRRYGRPILATEYMARPRGSRFDPHLGYFKEVKVFAYHWGLVSGKTQTIYPWDSWTKPYTAEPAVWFHDVFRSDGTPFDPEEAAYIRRILGRR
jgi:hypothetical protein